MRLRFWMPGMLAVAVMFLPLAGCSLKTINDAIPDQRLAYKKQSEASENLEIPPDLVGSSFDDSLDIPSPNSGPTTYSQYTGTLAQRRQDRNTGSDVLPTVANVQLVRQGDERWLQVDASPSDVWKKVLAFWQEQGILLVDQDPGVGIMRTDWLDNRAEIHKDFITRMISKVAGGLYATSTRDQYTIRLERGTNGKSTNVYLTHRGMTEKVMENTLGDSERTVWQPSGTDPEKEAEMLRRLMVYFGISKKTAGTLATPVAASRTGSSAADDRAARPGTITSQGGVQVLEIQQEFRSAWRLTSLALDRADFDVEDRDQSRGLFYVRYAGGGPNGKHSARPGEKKKGFFSRMAFWHKDKKGRDDVRQYLVHVEGNDQASRVGILDAQGQPDASPEAAQILRLLQDNMR